MGRKARSPPAGAEGPAGSEPRKERVKCPKCGTRVKPGRTLCPKCGGPLPVTEEQKEPKSLKKSLLSFARDIIIAVIAVVVVLGGIYAFTQVWPPMVVVESASMQHENGVSHIGVIDTGDLVLVQHAPARSDVITWVEGKASGYETYSNHGDVIIFRDPHRDTPTIHRPIFYMMRNSTTGTFDIPDLARLPLNVLWGGTNSGNIPVRSPYGLNGNIWLAESGWRGDINFTFAISTFIGSSWSGYVTMGDNNAYSRATGNPLRSSSGYDSYLVKQGDIIGKARGELPWFGLIKLTLYPTPGVCCTGWGDTVHAPANSWSLLLYSIILIIAVPILLDVFTNLFFRWRQARKNAKAGKEDDEEEAPDEKPPDSGGGTEGDSGEVVQGGEPPPSEPENGDEDIVKPGA